MRAALTKPDKPDGYGYHKHHVFGGTGRRQLSEKYNCFLYLPWWVHEGKNGPHHNRAYAQALHESFQRKLEAAGWTREEFIETFGRSYL